MISAAHRRALEARIRPLGAARVREIVRHGGLSEALREWTRRALAEHHLVTVAHALAEALELDADADALEQLGLPVDLLACFPGWRAGSRAGFSPGAPTARLAPRGASTPIGRIRVQLSHQAVTVPCALLLVQGLLRALDPSVRLVVVAEPGVNLAGLWELLEELVADAVDRVQVVEMPTATVFAQDNARIARAPDGSPILLIPRSFGAWGVRREDALDPDAARAVFGRPVQRTRLHWEGGNVLSDDRTLLVGADTIAQNVSLLGLTPEEVIACLGADLGATPVVLGDVTEARWDLETEELRGSGQASFHIDLDVSLLGEVAPGGRRVALVADPARGLDLVDHVLSRRALLRGHALSPARVAAQLEAEFDAYARERHPRVLAYAAILEELGYEVVGMPDLRVSPRDNVFGLENLHFSYCNVLPALHRGRPAVHYLPWGIAALDRDARRQLEAAGVVPIPITRRALLANRLMMFSGGLHCVCGPLD